MNKGMKRIYKYGDYIVSVLSVLILKIMIIFVSGYPMRVTGDELFLFALPAKLAGLDWSGCMYNYRYYGYGFSIFLVPLFKLIEEPLILYRIVLIMVAIIQSIIPLMCCYILKNVFRIKDKKINIMITFCCSFCVALYNGYMYNEHIYIIYVWCSFFCLVKVLSKERDIKHKVLWSIGLGLSFVGAQTIHQRALTLCLGYIVVYIFMLLFIKRKAGYASIVLVIYAIGYYCDRKLVEWNTKFLFSEQIQSGESSVSNLQNTDVTQILKINDSFWTDSVYIDAAIEILISNINNWNIFTFGVAAFSLVLIGVYLKKIFQNKLNETDIKIVAIGVFSIACIFITLAGLINSWGWGIGAAHIANDPTADSLRGLVYLRYFIAYYPACMMAVLVFIYKNKAEYLKNLRYTIMISGLCMSLWLKMVVDFVQNNNRTLGCLKNYVFYSKYTDEVTIREYLIGVLIVIIIFGVLWYIVKTKSFVLFMLVLCLLSTYQYTYNAVRESGMIGKINYLHSDGSRELIQSLRAENIEFEIYADKVIIKADRQDFLHQIQFMNMKEKIQAGIPPKDTENVIFITITEKTKEELIKSGYVKYAVDDNEYVYVKGAEIEEKTSQFLGIANN